MSRAIDTEALIARVCNIVDHAESLLAMQGEHANPSVSAELFELGREIEDFSWELAHADTALRMLRAVTEVLHKRAAAYAEVYGAPHPGDGDFEMTTSVGLKHFGERFGSADYCDEEVPF
jgi:hypothetical protein